MTKVHLADLIDKCRSLVKTISRSQILTAFVNRERENMRIRRGLAQDCITRWNSTYYFLESLVQNKQVLLNLFTNKREICASSKQRETLSSFELSSDDWAIIVLLLQVLNPFSQATKLMSGSHYPTIGLCLFTIRTIKDYLESQSDDDSSIKITLKAFLLDSLNKYFDEKDDQYTLLKVSIHT